MPDTIDLGNDLDAYVDALVRSGRFGSRDEVLREGLRLVVRREERRAVLDAALARGLADAESEKVKALEDVANRLTAKYKALV